MKVYIDSEFKCHTANDGTMTVVEVPYFDGKCEAFVEGHRFIPAGESWTNEDGEVFQGEMKTPWKDYNELEILQREHEKSRLADAENALAILLGGETV